MDDTNIPPTPSAERIEEIRRFRDAIGDNGFVVSVDSQRYLKDATFLLTSLSESEAEIGRLKGVIQLALSEMTEARCAGSGEDAYKNEMNEAAYKRLRDA